MPDNCWSVYMHTSPSGKAYIGITSMVPSKRWGGGSGYKHSAHFDAAIKKYGWPNIRHVIWAEGLSKYDACSLEKLLIGMFRTNDRRYGYNIDSGGLASKKSESTKQKMSESQKRLWASPEYRNHHSDGIKRYHEDNDEFRRLASNRTKAQWADEFMKEKMINGIKASQTDEWRSKVKAAARKRMDSQKGREWAREKAHAQWSDKEIRNRQVAAIREAASRPEHRKNVSNARKKAWENPDVRAKQVSSLRKKIAVRVVCVETGEVFECMRDAEVFAGSRHVCEACKGKQETCGGYHWRYADD